MPFEQSVPTEYGFSVPVSKIDDEEFVKRKARAILSQHLQTALKIMGLGVTPGLKYTQLDAIRRLVDAELAARMTRDRERDAERVFADSAQATVLMNIRQWEQLLDTLDKIEDDELTPQVETIYNTVASAVEVARGIGRWNNKNKKEES